MLVNRMLLCRLTTVMRRRFKYRYRQVACAYKTDNHLFCLQNSVRILILLTGYLLVLLLVIPELFVINAEFFQPQAQYPAGHTQFIGS